MSGESRDPLFSAAVLKLSMAKKGMTTKSGFRVVYHGTLKELGVSDEEVDRYIALNLPALLAHIESHQNGHQHSHPHKE